MTRGGPPPAALLLPCSRCTSGPRFFSPRHTSSGERRTSPSHTLETGVRSGWPTVPRGFPHLYPNTISQLSRPGRVAGGLSLAAWLLAQRAPAEGRAWGGVGEAARAWGGLPRAPEEGSPKHGHREHVGNAGLALRGGQYVQGAQPSSTCPRPPRGFPARRAQKHLTSGSYQVEVRGAAPFPGRGNPSPGHLLPAAPVGTGTAQQHGMGRRTQQTRWARSEPAFHGQPGRTPSAPPRPQVLTRPTPLPGWAEASLSALACRPHAPSLTSLWQRQTSPPGKHPLLS